MLWISETLYTKQYGRHLSQTDKLTRVVNKGLRNKKITIYK
jgi:hypothetical protein